MISFLALITKLIVIFISGGLLALFATWIGKEIYFITILAINYLIEDKKSKKVKILKQNNISAQSALYNFLLPNGEKIKVFSFHKGMRRID